MEEIRISLDDKDTEILQLKMNNQQLSSEGPGAAKALWAKNTELKKMVSILIKEVQGLNANVKDLTKKLLNSHVVESSRIEVLLKSLSSKLLST